MLNICQDPEMLKNIFMQDFLNVSLILIKSQLGTKQENLSV